MKVYFAGSIRSGRDNRKLCERAINEIKKRATVLTEHVGSPEISEKGEYYLDEKYIHDRDLDWVKEADLLIAEVTTPSTGVGYEIAHAVQLGKPVLCLFNNLQSKANLSGMLIGASKKPEMNLEIETYEDENDLDGILDKYLARHE